MGSPETTADTDAERVCHKEQLQVWGDELLEALAMGGYLREDMDYADKVDCHRAAQDEIKQIVTSAFDHPERTVATARTLERVAAWLEELERLAFSWPAPNPHTPQVVQWCNGVRAAIRRGEPMGGTDGG